VLRLGKILLRLVRVAALATLGLAVLLVILIYAVPLPARLDPGRSVVVEYRDGEIAYVFLSPDEKWRLPVELDRIDPAFIAALVELEDRRFFQHPGVDPFALVRALASNLRHGRRVSGGSTLTMQLARLLEPRPRTLPSKAIEMFRALQLETRRSKREILAAYLQLAPYGENIEGVESAALAYFGHRAAHLTPAEIATLLAVPQGPVRFAPSPENAERLRGRRDQILAKLARAGVVAADLPAPGPVPERLRPFPRGAAHAANWLRARAPDRNPIRSTLDAGAQALTERTLRLAAPDLERRRIHNGAVVVVDHRTREVVALVAYGGDIAMFDRPRSPGSTLKPFLYALAIDRGLALPGFLVADVPIAYGSYRPRNFDGNWNGLVTLQESLSRSLNLPFIGLLGQLGVDDFLGVLADLGVASPRRLPGAYGLSLIVGGIEVTPLELAGLYATLAEDGRYRPLRTLAGPDGPEVAAFGPGAAYLTKQALSLRDRPDFPARLGLRGVPAQIHWKTGTSFGFRDAWAVGSGPSHTAVVWVGNVDNHPSTELVGSEAAGPILFDTLEGLADRAHVPDVAAPPDDLGWVEVCAYSGHVATDACPRRTAVLAPLHAVPTAPCPYHVAYDVDVATGRAVLPMCRPRDAVVERKSFVVLPSGVARWLEDQHREVPEGPVFADGCAPAAPARAPAIVTPADGQIIVLIPGVPATRQELPLQVETRSPIVSWFVDGELLGTIASSQRLYWSPALGRHELVVADEAGQKSRRVVEVRRGGGR
jgi:penicillin-binding protein 1C